MNTEVEAKPQVYCYTGTKPCGCLVAAAVDRPEQAKDNAKYVAEWVRDGLTVERKTVEFVRANFATCTHEPEQLSILIGAGGA